MADREVGLEDGGAFAEGRLDGSHRVDWLDDAGQTGKWVYFSADVDHMSVFAALLCLRAFA